MTRLAVLAGLAGLALASCGKADLVAVKRPVMPINICRREHDEGYSPCKGEFDVGRLIGLHMADARRLAEAHGYELRREAPLAEHEGLLLDFIGRRIDVETDAPNESSVVVRYVGRG